MSERLPTASAALLPRVHERFEESAHVLRATREACAPAVVEAALLLIEAVSAGGRVLAFGNGGSAADAQHLAAELAGRFERERPAISALALTANSSDLTAIANDYDFERVFARLVEAHGRPGDVAVAISTSGTSKNVVAAAVAARQRGLHTVALTGRGGGALAGAVDVAVVVPAASTPRIQEAHGTIVHLLCELLEDALFPPEGDGDREAR